MSEPTPGPGADLKAAREGLQVSIREVADALNLPARVIEALEADDYERLPPTVFTRGYLRSYARLLELPADELLTRYPEVTEEVEPSAASRTGAHAVVTRSRSLLLPMVIGAIVVVLLLVWLQRDDKPKSGADRPLPAAQDRDGGEPPPPLTPLPADRTTVAPEATAAAEPPPMPEQMPEQMTEQMPEQMAEQPSPVIESAVDSPVREAPPVEAEPAPAPAVVTDTAVTSPAEAVAAPPAATFRARRLTEFGDDRVVLRFSEDCWVEVKTLDGASLYSDLNRTGTTLELTGHAPFRVLLGYAPGVNLEFNGEQVALSRYSRNNVASLVLGQ